MPGPNCGNNPNFKLSEADRKAMEDFLAYLASRNSKAIICYARCENCMYGTCPEPHGEHGWAGPEDTEHARQTGQPKPTEICACECTRTFEQTG